MDIYEKLSENPLFFKWIFYPSEELDQWWNSYINMNPGEKEKILKFKEQFTKYLKFSNTNLTDNEKKALARKILSSLNAADKKRERTFLVRNFMKYAAVAVLFFFTGSALVYFYMDSRPPEMVTESAGLPFNASGPVLIIDNQQKIALGEGESELDYSGKEKVMINRDQVIEKKTVNRIPEMNTLVIPYGSRSHLTLSDGSKVWLNAGSRLIYPSEFIDKYREVFLVGEAFFDVVKNESQPFLVKTPDLEINVLGTRFNISAYPEDYSVQTVLAEGKVKISRINAGVFEKGNILLPGQMAYYSKTSKETRIHDVDVEHYTLWTQGLFSFSNTDFNRITKKLERYYNIRFQFDDPLKGTIQISGKLDVTRERNEVFEYLTKLTGLDFVEINEYQYLIK